ncbi:unnamed protein product [Microthlaspi erraticum]|uniref:Uncharacterized protein n=1 Tax=Microthlaspi erraticum TaxID=1685480 RepID=A0A6D2JTZ9_9BRAS|nr:unnamed protein product [Microthlaspi erraticum]
MFRARPNLVRPSEVSAKVQNRRPITQSRPGKHCPRSATPRHDAHDQSARAGKRLAAAQLISRTTPMPSEPGNYVPRPAEISSAKFIRPTTPADRIRPTPTVPTRPHTRLSGRSSRTTVPTPRSTRSPF